MRDIQRIQCGCLRIRYYVIVVTFLFMVCIFAMRLNLSVAINSMVVSPTSRFMNGTFENVTSFEIIVEREDLGNAGKFTWDGKTQSFIIGAFFYGYVAGVLLTSQFVQRFGVRWYSGLAMLMCSVLTILTPMSAHWGPGYLMAVRSLQGVLQGVLIPTLNMVVAEWVPVLERSRAYTFIGNGVNLGAIVGMFLSGVLVDCPWGWPSAFYVPGGLGFLCYISWLLLVYNSPSQHPFISDEEKHFIMNNRGNKQIKQNYKVPWKSILKSTPVWAYCLAASGQLFCAYVLLLEMPIYLFQVLHFDGRTSGILSAIPAVLRILVSLVASFVADAMRKSEKVSINFIRKFMQFIGAFPAGLCMLAIAFVGCRSYVIVGLLCAYSGFDAITISGCAVTPVDMSPRFAATIGPMAFTIGNLGGAVLPYIVSEITKTGPTLENWSWVFIMSAVVCFVASLIFILFGSATVQPWNSSDSIEQNIECPVAVQEPTDLSIMPKMQNSALRNS